MFDRFGEFDSAAEINETAVNLRKEGDKDSIKVLAEENGIGTDILEAFIDGDILYLCDDMSAAIGKIEVEAKKLRCVENMGDCLEYIRSQCMERPEMAKMVRSKGKSLAGCVTEMLRWSFKHQIPVDKELVKAAGVTAGRCTIGFPGNARTKEIVTAYYMGR